MFLFRILTQKWRRQHIEEFYDLYSSSRNIIQVTKSRRIRWTGHVACVKDRGGVQTVLVGTPKGQTQFGRPRCRQDDSIQMVLQEVGWGGRHRLDWSGSWQGQAGSFCEYSNKPSRSINGLAEELLCYKKDLSPCNWLVGWLVGWSAGWLVSQSVTFMFLEGRTATFCWPLTYIAHTYETL